MPIGTCCERVPPTTAMNVSLAILIKTYVQVHLAVSSKAAVVAVGRVLASLKMERKSITIESLILYPDYITSHNFTARADLTIFTDKASTTHRNLRDWLLMTIVVLLRTLYPRRMSDWTLYMTANISPIFLFCENVTVYLQETMYGWVAPQGNNVSLIPLTYGRLVEEAKNLLYLIWSSP